MKNLFTALNKACLEIEGVEKKLNVGTGNSSYKGVSDKDVKIIVGGALKRNGLMVIPKSIVANCQVLEKKSMYNGQEQIKYERFTSVDTMYTLAHTSGEMLDFPGYGHGVDPQDKSAGKATTYALKYALLYLTMAPTGDIDDSDKEHSDKPSVPPPPAPPKNTPMGTEIKKTPTPAPAPAPKLEVVKKLIIQGTDDWKNALKYVAEGNHMDKLNVRFIFTPFTKDAFIKELGELKMKSLVMEAKEVKPSPEKPKEEMAPPPATKPTPKTFKKKDNAK